MRRKKEAKNIWEVIIENFLNFMQNINVYNQGVQNSPRVNPSGKYNNYVYMH